MVLDVDLRLWEVSTVEPSEPRRVVGQGRQWGRRGVGWEHWERERVGQRGRQEIALSPLGLGRSRERRENETLNGDLGVRFFRVIYISQVSSPTG